MIQHQGTKKNNRQDMKHRRKKEMSYRMCLRGQFSLPLPFLVTWCPGVEIRLRCHIFQME